ncbi:MAG: hypothetical protein OXG35_24920, partial [Acidobacteria bacterium]|nr:hypothetical protein [Acidobacteriota bacterium]
PRGQLAGRVCSGVVDLLANRGGASHVGQLAGRMCSGASPRPPGSRDPPLALAPSVGVRSGHAIAPAMLAGPQPEKVAHW